MPPAGRRNPLLDQKRKKEFWELIDDLCRRQGITRNQLWKIVGVSTSDRYKLQKGELWFGQRMKILSKAVQVLRATGDDRRKLYLLNDIDVEGVDATSSPYADLAAQIERNQRELLAHLNALPATVPDVALASALTWAVRAGMPPPDPIEVRRKFCDNVLEILRQSDRPEVARARAETYAFSAFTEALSAGIVAVRDGFLRDHGPFERASNAEEQAVLTRVIEHATQAFILWADWPSQITLLPINLLDLVLAAALQAGGLSIEEQQRQMNKLLAPFGLRESGSDVPRLRLVTIGPQEADPIQPAAIGDGRGTSRR